MSVYAIAGIVVAGLVFLGLAVNYLFFRVGTSEGSAATEATIAKDDATAQRKADATVMTEVSKDDLQKSLRDGTF